MTREELITLLKSRKKYLETIISLCEEKLASAPEGHLIASRSHGTAQYYFCDDSDFNRTYLNDKNLAEKLVSKDYHSKVLSSARKELGIISRFLKGISIVPIEEIYRHLPSMKQELVQPICIDKETYAKQWAEAEYPKLDFKIGEEFISNDGKRYRSKSELLIANALKDAGVPFRYECRLDLKGYSSVYPDFTVLNKRTGQVYYHEHLGMMENSDYLIKNLQKINAYEKNGIMQGKQLILTYESEHVNLDMNVINNIIKEFYI
jgi:hypothetical protein